MNKIILADGSVVLAESVTLEPRNEYQEAFQVITGEVE